MKRRTDGNVCSDAGYAAFDVHFDWSIMPPRMGVQKLHATHSTIESSIFRWMKFETSHSLFSLIIDQSDRQAGHTLMSLTAHHTQSPSSSSESAAAAASASSHPQRHRRLPGVSERVMEHPLLRLSARLLQLLPCWLRGREAETRFASAPPSSAEGRSSARDLPTSAGRRALAAGRCTGGVILVALQRR